jgi:DHA2 family multidrug resistance protein
MEFISSPFRGKKLTWSKTAILFALLFLQAGILGVSVVTAPWLNTRFGLKIPSIIFAGQLNAVAYIVIMPLYFRLRLFFRRRYLLVFVLTSECLLSLSVIFIHQYISMLLVLFLLGISRAICILDCINLMGSTIPWLRHRPIFYGILYMVIKSGNMISDIIIGVVNHKSQTGIILYSALAAISSLVIALIAFHGDKLQKPVALKSIAWGSMLQLYISCASLCYICSFGKAYNWLASWHIWIAFILLISSAIFFLYTQLKAVKPLWDFRVFRRHKHVAVGMAFMFILYFFFTSAGLTTRFAFYQAGAKEVIGTSLVTALAYLIAFPLTGLMLLCGIGRQWLISAGFIIYACSYFAFYNGVIRPHQLSLLYLVCILQGSAYAILLTTLSTFMSTNIDEKHRRDRLMASLISRYVIGAAIFSAIFNTLIPVETTLADLTSDLISLLPLLTGMALIVGGCVLLIQLFEIKDQAGTNNSI